MILKDDPKAYAIMGCAIKVHSTLGDGFLESAYGDALEVEFKKAGIPYLREDSVRIYYDGQPLPTNYRADFTCFDRFSTTPLNLPSCRLHPSSWGLGWNPSSKTPTVK